MDMDNNRIPEQVRTIHLIAVCGTAMGALACMLQDMGYAVTGSDHSVYPPMSDFLRDKGIQLFDGYSADNMRYHPDLVVVGNAVKKDNPEVVYTVENNIPFCSMPQALKGFAGQGKSAIAVSGTHGKTTTSSLMAWTLFDAGLEPSFMIGGIVANFTSNYRLGTGNHIVFEGDEYDTAFFDKGPKFLHYDPRLTILTSVEFDHADIFRDMDAVLQAFDQFLDQMAPSDILIACGDDPHVRKLIQHRSCQIETYGVAVPDVSWRPGHVRMENGQQVFEVIHDGRFFGTFRLKMMGAHNLANAMAVIAAAHRLGISPERISQALMEFDGVKRRQEVRGVVRDITIMDDFAHHPTAVRETLKGVRSFFSKGRVIAVFEPRTNSSKRKVFQDAYAQAFGAADLVCIAAPEHLEKVPEGDRFSVGKLVEDLSSQGYRAHYFEQVSTILDFICKEARPGDVVVIMSSGGFGNIHKRLLDCLA